MSDPVTPTAQIQRFRDEAADRLNDAAQCSDPAQRDSLVSEALALLAQARSLRSRVEYDVQVSSEHDAVAGPSSTRMQ